ncbi:MAG: hypothetical protein G8345_03195 [Magnetococcales bacterium]|nr:PilN domain-containing protein [Magnetococcales bacterium]NGZ25879.1 hypothetical protein [Magnetococcales bacterium]
MIKINLLPYRKERRLKQANTIILGWAGAAFLGVIIALGIDFYMSSVIEELQAAKAENEEQIKKLDAQLGELKKLDEMKAALQKRLDVVAQLSKNRDLPERILTELSNTIPSKIWFKSLDIKVDKMTLHGYSESNSDIADFMTSLGKSPLFQNVELGRSSDELVQGVSLKSFELNVGIKPSS